MSAHYDESCPFCRISKTYPYDPTSIIPTSPDPTAIVPNTHLLLSTPNVLAFLDILPITHGHILLTTRHHCEKLSDVPSQSVEATSTQAPSIQATQSTTSMPIDSTDHDGKVSSLTKTTTTASAIAAIEGPTSSHALGFWMPVLSRALRRTLAIDDWNVVQNNGARAAQVVPHVHFHFIPRYAEGLKYTPPRTGLPGGDGDGGGGTAASTGVATSTSTAENHMPTDTKPAFETDTDTDTENTNTNPKAKTATATQTTKGATAPPPAAPAKNTNWDVGELKSWRMFGKGTREELDDEQALLLSAAIRAQLRAEMDPIMAVMEPRAKDGDCTRASSENGTGGTGSTRCKCSMAAARAGSRAKL